MRFVLSPRQIARLRPGRGPALLALAILASDGTANARLIDSLRSSIALAVHLPSGATLRALGELRTPQGGEYVLPSPVQSMLRLLRNQDVESYRLSPGIVADGEIVQRITESAFPIRHSATARYLLTLAGEDSPPPCKPLAAEKEAALAVCD